jgi:hypothetical protein
MLPFVLALIAAARVFFQSRTDIAVEVLALRQQVAVLKRRRSRPQLRSLDPILDGPAGDLVSLEGCALHGQAGNGRWLASGWISALLALEISAAWRPAEDQRGGSRPDSAAGAGELRLGRPENPGRIAEARLRALRETVARYLRRIHRRGNPAKKWLAFLHNHREAIVALDLFTVPTATFRVVYCFFVIEHGRRRILHYAHRVRKRQVQISVSSGKINCQTHALWKRPTSPRALA